MGDPKSKKTQQPPPQYRKAKLSDILIPGYGLPWKERLRWPKIFLGGVLVYFIAIKIVSKKIKKDVREEMRQAAEEQSKWEFEHLIEVEKNIIKEERAKARAIAKKEEEKAFV